MPEFLSEFFSSEFFMPHGHCYLWKPELVWLQVLSNGGIAAAYVAIFLTLVYLVKSIRDLPFQWMYSAFALFIVACGVTHIFDVYVIWHPAYWLDGAVRAVTAVASIGTAILLPPLVPKAVALAEAAAMSHERGIKLEQANTELGVLLDRTKELERLKSDFFANVSHELRTPLSLIIAPVEKLLSSGALNEEQRKDLGIALRNAQSLLHQVNDLLDVAKLEAGKLRARYVQADLAGLVRVTAAQFETLAAERGIEYGVRTPDAVPAELDADKVQRALLNLVSNAFKFTPEGGTIRCELRHVSNGEQSSAVIEVADSGPGVPAEHRAVIFERFRQLEGGTTRRFGGTGLGLAIAKDFAELHGGQIDVSDAPEGGALFTIELPLRAPSGTEVPASTESAGQLAGIVAQRIGSELGGERALTAAASPDGEALVLVVEDNRDLNSFLTDALAKDYRVASARDGAEGLALARELRPSVILTDMMMPRVGGDELLRAVQADPELQHIPVVVLTAKGDDDLRLRLLRAGAQDYILKPFSLEEVRARIGNLVSMKLARDVLQDELRSNAQDLSTLAREVTLRQRELKTALDSLTVARDQALHASEAKTAFLSMVSHELRTPLTTLRLQIDRVKRYGGSQERYERSLAKADASCKRLEQIIDSLLEHARIQSGRLQVRLEPTDLAAVVATAVDELQAQAQQKSLTLRSKAARDLPAVTTDKDLLRLILVNLIANAIKFTQQGGVTVGVDAEAQLASISVTDTGPGISPAEQIRIFEPFEQIEQVRHKHIPGVGLGLALVREMVQALGGQVRVQSSVGEGSTFIVTIPVEPPSAANFQD